MGTLIVRNIDDGIVEMLKERASRNGRSMEAEHREILRAILACDCKAEAVRRLDEFRATLTGRHHTPSEILLRESREER